MRGLRYAAAAAAFAIVAGACGGAAGPKPTVRIASFNFTESEILGELYGQTLAASGYTVEYKHRLGTREIVFPALEKGDIDFVPEYLATVLAFATKSATKVGDAAEAHKQLQAAVKERRLTVLSFSSAVDTNAFVVTKATADKYKLKKMSDLVPLAGQLTLGAPPTCPQRPFCLPGLEQTYGIKFKEFKPLDSGGPITVAALEGNQVDVALLFSTDANITVKGFVLLEDDKRLQAADNVAPLVRDELIAKGGDDFKRLVNGVSAKLTTAELTGLNKLVGVDKKDAKVVAADWLKKQGLVK